MKLDSNSIYDPKVPEKLKNTQLWFGGVIGQAIGEESLIPPIAPSGRPIRQEVAEVIIPSPTLRPDERIQIYHQQYWWRLLNTLHKMFPMATRLFGYKDFNEKIAVPYILKYRPNHYSLSHLGDLLPKWIKEDYVGESVKDVGCGGGGRCGCGGNGKIEEERDFILDVIKVDLAFERSFYAAHSAPLQSVGVESQSLGSSQPSQPSQPLHSSQSLGSSQLSYPTQPSQPLHSSQLFESSNQSNSPVSTPTSIFSSMAELQPHIHLFALPYDLFSFRDILISYDPDYWLVNDFPKLDKHRQYYHILYRNLNNHVVLQQLSEGEFALLERFKNGSSIELAIEWLESQGGNLYNEATQFLHLWIQRWIVNEWLKKYGS